MLASACIASRIAGRPTPKRSTRSRSDGIGSPIDSSPSVIMAFRRSNTSWESLRRMIVSVVSGINSLRQAWQPITLDVRLGEPGLTGTLAFRRKKEIVGAHLSAFEGNFQPLAGSIG